MLRREKVNIDFQIINLSYPGQISDSILNIFGENFRKYKPDLVICHFGVNDSSVALNPFLKMNIFGIIVPSYIRKIKLVKLIMLSYLFNKERKYISRGEDGHFIFYNKNLVEDKSNLEYLDNTKRNYQNVLDVIKEYKTPYIMLSYFDAIDSYYELMLDLQKKNRAHYIDLNLHGEENTSHFFSGDMWHPSVKGHTLIANKIVELIKSNNKYFFK